ncbi:MAG: replication factor C small subunit [Thermoplasmata archaeon]|jgi:replication factor C small subunit
MEDIWVEKYRPVKLDDIVGQNLIVERLKAYAKEKNMPHLLFAGPPGTGKTTSAIALAIALYGEDWKNNFHELNASDERGIDVVRTQIKDFARTAPAGDVPFKIIFLDEADHLTADAQAALRRTMEKYSKTCRFILSCNYSSKIIEPIQSRTSVFRFRALTEDEVIQRLKYIAQNEKIMVDMDAYKAIYAITNGDMRKAINLLQAAASMGKEITADLIYKASGLPSREMIRNLLEKSLIEGDFLGARDFLTKMVTENGFSSEDIVKQIHSELFRMNIPEDILIEIIDKLAEVNFMISEGADDRINMDALIAKLVLYSRRLNNKNV